MALKYENPEEDELQGLSPEQFLENKKRSMRTASYSGIAIGVIIVLFHVALIYGLGFSVFIVFRSIFFALGLLTILGGLWGLYEAKRLSLEDYIPTPEAILFAKQGAQIKPFFTYALLGALIAVFLVQTLNNFERSLELTALDKHLVWQGQWWRLLTGATVHVWTLHIYFNGQALYGFGTAIEYLSNRAHLAAVFLLSVIGGSLLSLFLTPDINSAGASGGIMGLVGYLAIYGYWRKRQLPPGFLRNMLINIGFIAAFGIIAYQIVDNAAHLGGLLAGTAYGFVQIPKDPHKDPRKANALTVALSYICLAIFLGFSVLSILLIMRKIVL